MKIVCQHLYELAEVNALVGDIIEYSLVAVALIFDISYLHLQSEVLCNLPALNHCSVLATLCLVVFLHVDRLCYAIHTLDVVSRTEVCLLHLHRHQSPGECHHANVVSGICLHCHYIALLQVKVVDVMVVALSGVFELYLHKVGSLCVARNVSQPVECVQLFVRTVHSSVT